MKFKLDETVESEMIQLVFLKELKTSNQQTLKNVLLCSS
jgi:hypothetical protein